MSSMTGLVTNPPNLYYSCTKYALEALTEGLAKEVAPFGIRVTAIEPGAIRTDWATRSDAGDRDAPVAGHDEPPLHLLLGRDVLAAFRQKLADWQANLDAWESVTKDVNFPHG